MEFELSQVSEIRNWIVFILGIIGALITIRTFRSNNQQRKLDNTYKTLDYLRRHITSHQIDRFIVLFQANNPIVAEENEFKLSKDEVQYVEDMFSEGGCGNGEIYNMIQIFDLISRVLNKNLLITELIWYEYGQMISKCYEWTHLIEIHDEKTYHSLSEVDQRFLKRHKPFYYHLNTFMNRNKEIMIDLPTKLYTDIE